MSEEKNQKAYHLQLPKTSFEMRGRLAEKEPKWLAFWKEIELEAKRAANRQGAHRFVLHDGPPYANGHLHLGHAVNKIAKDIVNRFYWSKGYNTPYVPGWDCHGLPIEAKVLEASGKKGAENPLAFRKACATFAQKWIDIQKGEFQRMGLLGFEGPCYTTMSRNAEEAIIKGFFDLCQQGLVYKGLKPVFWSVVEQTALAEAEVEYKDVTSPSFYVCFPFTKTTHPALEGASALIWTTTPWTLPANRAIAYGDLEYLVCETQQSMQGEQKRFVVAKDCLPALKNSADLQEVKVIAQLAPKDLEGAVCQHPLKEKGYTFDVPLVFGTHVTNTAGTGLVHTAPAYGVDDFALGRAHNLEVADVIDDNGTFKETVPLFAGLHIYKAEKPVTEALSEAGTLFYKDSLRHSYPHSWRSRTPLIYRATPQWFLGLDQQGAGDGAERAPSLRAKALNALDSIRFFPKAGRARLESMVQNRPDWCLSRQRTWGIPLMLFVDQKTDALLVNAHVNQKLLELVKEGGSDIWWQIEPDTFLKPFGFTGYKKVTDILDVWFESGMTHRFVLEKPADLYLEGSDQHRGWFQSSLVLGAALWGHSPFEQLLTHGFVVDDQGYKLSKSLGNAMAPAEIIKQHGADMLRLWVASNNIYDDIKMGPQALKSVQDIYRRIRNTFRFLLGNLSDFKKSSAQKMPDTKKWAPLERFMLSRLVACFEALQKAFQQYDFAAITTLLHRFCNQELSAFYFDIRKDSLYCDAPQDKARLETQQTLDAILQALLTWFAPLLPFTTEEAFQASQSSGAAGGQSVHLQDMWCPDASWRDLKLETMFEKLQTIRRCVLAALEKERTEGRIKASLEAAPHLYIADDQLHEAAESYGEALLAELCITSGCKIIKGEPPANAPAFQSDEATGLWVVPLKANEEKCPRCWRLKTLVPHMPSAKTPSEAPDLLCVRCNRVELLLKEHACAV